MACLSLRVFLAKAWHDRKRLVTPNIYAGLSDSRATTTLVERLEETLSLLDPRCLDGID